MCVCVRAQHREGECRELQGKVAGGKKRMQELTESDWERVWRGEEEEDTLTGTIDKEENHPIMCARVYCTYVHSIVISWYFISSDIQSTYAARRANEILAKRNIGNLKVKFDYAYA